MVKKIIQVPLDKELLVSLNMASKKQQRARADLIREACLIYLRQVEEEEMDEIYSRGYRKIPEKEDTGRTQAALISRVLPLEHW